MYIESTHVYVMCVCLEYVICRVCVVYVYTEYIYLRYMVGACVHVECGVYVFVCSQKKQWKTSYEGCISHTVLLMEKVFWKQQMVWKTQL